MIFFTKAKCNVFCSIATLLFFVGCSGQDRVLVTTGTQIGLEATPGDGATQAPNVSFGYKRVELALVPVSPTSDKESKVKTPEELKAETPEDPKGGSQNEDSKLATKSKDAYSVLATFNMASNWFGPAKIEQFIATGHASRSIQSPNSQFFQTVSSSFYGYDENAEKFNGLLMASLEQAPTDGKPDPFAGEKKCWIAIHAWKEKDLPGLSDYDFAILEPYKVRRKESVTEIKADVNKPCAGFL